MDQNTEVNKSLSLLENAALVVSQTSEGADRVADKVVELLEERLDSNPDSIPTKTLFEYLNRHNANKVASQAVIKDLAVEIIKLKNNSTDSLQPSNIVKKDSQISALLTGNAKGNSNGDE